jgi:hypothetical protein
MVDHPLQLSLQVLATVLHVARQEPHSFEPAAEPFLIDHDA